MIYRWTSEREEANIKKHHIDFSMASRILESGTIISDFYGINSRISRYEEGFLNIVAIRSSFFMICLRMESGIVSSIISARKLQEHEVMRLWC